MNKFLTATAVAVLLSSGVASAEEEQVSLTTKLDNPAVCGFTATNTTTNNAGVTITDTFPTFLLEGNLEEFVNNAKSLGGPEVVIDAQCNTKAEFSFKSENGGFLDSGETSTELETKLEYTALFRLTLPVAGPINFQPADLPSTEELIGVFNSKTTGGFPSSPLSIRIKSEGPTPFDPANYIAGEYTDTITVYLRPAA